MKKKGFTLIELLGVIVVLAIIALITVPTIIGVVDKSRKSTLQNSGYGLVEAGILYYAEKQNSKTIRFDIKDNEVVSEEENKLTYKGNIKEGTVLINNRGEVTVCINDGKYAAYKNFKDNKVIVVDNKSCNIPENSSIVYLNNEATIDIDIEELVSKMNQMEQEIEKLKLEKANNTDLTTSISNLTTTHSSDISNLTNQITSLRNDLGTIHSQLDLSNRTEVSRNLRIESQDTTLLHTFEAPKDGFYIFTGYVSFADKGEGVLMVSVAGVSNYYSQISATPISHFTYIPISESHYMKKGEKFEFKAYQYSSTALDIGFYMIIESSN